MAEQKWRVEVDKETCIGSGMCTGVAPKHFALADGLSSPANEFIAPDDAVVDAAESCPVEAILVRAADTGEVVAPEQ